MTYNARLRVAKSPIFQEELLQLEQVRVQEQIPEDRHLQERMIRIHETTRSTYRDKGPRGEHLQQSVRLAIQTQSHGQHAVRDKVPERSMTQHMNVHDGIVSNQTPVHPMVLSNPRAGNLQR
jgi:hypothetical protein